MPDRSAVDGPRASDGANPSRRPEGGRPAALGGPLVSRASGALSGAVEAPGDKSISHRALILGALAEGETEIAGLLEAEDVLRTAGAMRALGAAIERDLRSDLSRPGSPLAPVWRVTGANWNGGRGAGWRAPERPLYFGNSGTGCRLSLGAIAGALSGHEPSGVSSARIRFDGDGSLRGRPMGRIAAPLMKMGAAVELNAGLLPATLAAAPLKGVEFELPVASAQIKSAALLAGLGAEGPTTIIEPSPSRDHTERMLPAFGGVISVETDARGGRRIVIPGRQRLRAAKIETPGDPSSAAFIVAAAVIAPGSDVTVRNVLVNPLRTGFFTTLKQMGADIAFTNERLAGGEPVADIRARASRLSGVAVPASRAPSMIDEYPILAAVAAFADGDVYMPGLQELRVKESDRLAAIEAGLKANGVETDSGPDWLRVCGTGKPPSGGGRVVTHGDHRIAMSFLVMGLGAGEGVEIDDGAMIATSFPQFLHLLSALGADVASAAR